MQKLFLLFLFFGLLAMTSIGLFRASTLASYQANIPPIAAPEIDKNLAAQRLAAAIACPTTPSSSDQHFDKFWHHITSQYPNLHKHPKIKIASFSQHSAVYKWEGQNPAAAPILLIAPIATPEPALDKLPQWSYDPYLGKIADGYIWGAGTMRSKTNLIAIFEAVELLAKNNYQPQHTIFLLACHNNLGPKKPTQLAIAAEMQALGISFHHILAAGSQIHQEIWQSPAPAALVAVSEPAELQINIATQDSQWAAAARSIANLPIDENIYTPANQYFIDYISPELNFTDKLILANSWITFGHNQQLIANTPRLTQLQKGRLQIHINNSPDSASVCLRLLLPASIDLEAHWNKIQAILDNNKLQYNLSYKCFGINHNPKNKSFELLQTTIKQTMGNVLVLPATADEASGGALFAYQNTPALQFSPLRCNDSDYQRLISGVDERISIDNYAEMIAFYIQYIKNADI